MPAELAQHVIDGTNLIYFEWELTGDKLIRWRYLDDVVRMLFVERGPLLREYFPSLQWVARNRTNLLHSVTEVKQLDRSRFSFARKSTVGLNGLELDFLVNWLETDRFPGGFQSLLITNQVPIQSKLIRRPQRSSSTNDIQIQK